MAPHLAPCFALFAAQRPLGAKAGQSGAPQRLSLTLRRPASGRVGAVCRLRRGASRAPLAEPAGARGFARATGCEPLPLAARRFARAPGGTCGGASLRPRPPRSSLFGDLQAGGSGPSAACGARLRPRPWRILRGARGFARATGCGPLPLAARRFARAPGGSCGGARLRPRPPRSSLFGDLQVGGSGLSPACGAALRARPWRDLRPGRSACGRGGRSLRSCPGAPAGFPPLAARRFARAPGGTCGRAC